MLRSHRSSIAKLEHTVRNCPTIRVFSSSELGMMRRLLISLTLILAATNLFGQTEAQGPNQTQKPKPEGNCTVSGRVVSAADGSPLKSARVGLVQADTHDHPQVYGNTTEIGRASCRERVCLYV